MAKYRDFDDDYEYEDDKYIYEDEKTPGHRNVNDYSVEEKIIRSLSARIRRKNANAGS